MRLETLRCRCFSLDLQHEIEALKAKLGVADSKMEQLQTRCAEERHSYHVSLTRLQEDFEKHKDRYERCVRGV